MPPTPSQIREQLLKAIDQDAKVINMVCVLEAISCLENTQITKEALEETRLGKIVNDIRKNTNDSSLSARCKKLVRVWSKQFVRGGTPAVSKPTGSAAQDASSNRQPTPPTQGTTTSTASTGGSRTPSLKSQTSTTPTSSVDKRKSENRKRRKLSTSPSSATSTGSDPPSTKKLKPAASTPTSNATKEQQSSRETNNGMPAQKVAGKSNLQSSKSAFSKVKPSESKPSSRTSSPALKAKSTSSPDVSKLNANSSRAVTKSPLTKQASSPVISKSSKLSPAPTDSSKSSKLSPSVKAKQLKDSNSLDSSRLQADVGPADETPRDKVTSSRLQGKSPTIPKSLEDSNSSSATVKLRSPVPERGLTPTEATCSSESTNLDDSQRVSQPTEAGSVQNEEFSRTGFSIFDDDFDEQDNTHCDEKYSKTLVDFEKGPTFSSLTRTADKDDPAGGRISGTPSVDVNDETDRPEGKEVLQESTDLDLASTELEEEKVPSKPVTEEDISKLHHQQWEGVNGCYGNQMEWSDWTQCMSVPIEEDNALHILPYVCFD